jgi:hypothetical protein
MDPEYHLENEDGSYSPAIIDLRFDADMIATSTRRSPRAWIREFFKGQAAERASLVAAGRIVR